MLRPKQHFGYPTSILFTVFRDNYVWIMKAKKIIVQLKQFFGYRKEKNIVLVFGNGMLKRYGEKTRGFNDINII